MHVPAKVAPCLWFDDEAEEAAKYDVSIFKNSKIVAVARYPKAGQEIHKRPVGSVMTVDFELNGQPFTALNGGPVFTFNEAVSLQIYCDAQDEIDYYWDKLSRGGDPLIAAVRMAEGQIRAVVADRSEGAAGLVQGSPIRKSAAGDGSHAWHEEDQHRRARARDGGGQIEPVPTGRGLRDG